MVTEKNEAEFSSKMDNIFDIAHANSEKMVSDREDYKFLLKQRECGRPGAIVGNDIKGELKRTRSAKRLHEFKGREEHN